MMPLIDPRRRVWRAAGLRPRARHTALLIIIAVGAALPTPSPAAPARALAPPSTVAPSPWRDRPDVQAFIQKMVQSHGFDGPMLQALFARLGRSEQALALIAPPTTDRARVWADYRARFIEPRRLGAGARFWRDHAALLQRAAQRWEVPEAIIVAILGIETFYGRQTGRFNVLEVLTTLAFDDPRRATYFRSELEQFLILARESHADPRVVLGSFAGAMGLPQFMPSSIRRFAVDFDEDGRIDLSGSAADAIGSVARFLSAHGWRAGLPTHFAATISHPEQARATAAAGAGQPPRLTLPELQTLGIRSNQDAAAHQPLSLIDLPNGPAQTDYVLGTHNFWVITRYNRSYFYAMAVIELAQALEAQRAAPAREPS